MKRPSKRLLLLTIVLREPQRRYMRIADGAAAFRAVVELAEPTLVTVEVSAPHIKRQARTLSQTQVWLIPGKPINGDGLIIEVPGMIVDVLSPQAHRYAKLAEGPFEITAYQARQLPLHRLRL